MQQNKKSKKDNTDTLRKNLEDKLPKNVRQIGNVSGNAKVYIQEFVLNYLKRKQKDVQQDGGTYTFVLIGEKLVAQKATYFFISGAVGVEIDVKENSGALSDEMKKQLASTIEKYYGNENSALCQIGWSSSLIVENKIPDEYEGFHRENFGAGNIVFLGFCEDGEEILYINENGKLKKQNGYYVYFERNEGMQQYIEDNQSGKCVEMEESYKGKTETYRMLLANHKEDLQHKNVVTFLYTASTFLVMVVIVLGITLINHYDKMKDMEGVIASLSKNVINGESDVTEPAIQTEDLDWQMDVTVTGDGSIASEQGASVSEPAVDTGQIAQEMPVDEEGQTGDNAEISEDAMAQSHEVSNNQAEEKFREKQQAILEEEFRKYQVQEGDTLTGICKKLYGSLEYLDKICEYNGIENSDQIICGQNIWVP